jgi:FtsH-binding integral membrane protein
MLNPHQWHFPLARRILFPYSGETPLTFKQGLRVVLVWTLFFSLPLTLIVLLITLIQRASGERIVNSVVFAFLSCAFIFGVLSVLIVLLSNRAAHIRQAWKARNGRS